MENDYPVITELKLPVSEIYAQLGRTTMLMHHFRNSTDKLAKELKAANERREARQKIADKVESILARENANLKTAKANIAEALKLLRENPDVRAWTMKATWSEDLALAAPVTK